MSVTVYIWEPRAGSAFNILLYDLILKYIRPLKDKDFTRTGHASIEINQKYISHRPYLNKGKKDLGQVLVNTQSLTYEEECKMPNRGEATRIYIINSLNEEKIIAYYNAHKSFKSYHFARNNCCTVVFNLLKHGMKCPEKEGSCLDCSPKHYSFRSYSGFLTICSFLFGSFIMRLTFELINCYPEAFLYLLILPLCYCFLLMGLFYYLMNIWTPTHLNRFVKKLEERGNSLCRSSVRISH